MRANEAPAGIPPDNRRSGDAIMPFKFLFNWGRTNKVKREIIVNAESLETRVAIMENGKLEEFQVEHPAEERIVGSVFKGKIQNIEHDLQAAFVDIGMSKNAFLHYWDMIPEEADDFDEDAPSFDRRRRRGGSKKRMSSPEIEKRFPPGSDIVAQVVKGPIGTKGPRVTAALSLSGRYLVMMPDSKLKGVSRKIGDQKERQRLKAILDRLPVPDRVGIIVRTAAEGARKRSFARDLRGLLNRLQELERDVREKPAPCCLYQEPDLVERVVRDWLTEDVDNIVVDDRDAFEKIREVAGRMSRRSRSRIHFYEGEVPIFDHYGVERQIENAFRRHVTLKSGACLVFDETEAMIAIDVNSGRHKGSGSQEDAILRINTDAVEEVARQLRLRNIGGLVVVDLIDMRSRKHQNAILKAMKTALRRDRARTNVLPISELGLMEMTRQRQEESLWSTRHVDCPYCNGRGAVRSTLAMSVEIQRRIAAAIRKQKRLDRSDELQVIVHPTVLERLRRKDEEFLIAMESKLGARLSFKSNPAKHMEYFSIHDAKTGEALYTSL
ncbi:MAG: Rne/Rng family ribonuclease [Verrucomicrobiota bacterium]|nr:Rne/Rng family ribonuclease [Verrucomicrobiota bacterium]